MEGLRLIALPSVHQDARSLFLVAAPPDVGPVPRYPHRRRRVSNRPTSVDPLTQPESSLRGEWSITGI